MATRNPRPPGHQTVTPYLGVTDPVGLIAFYQRAFDAEEVMLVRSGNVVTHAEVRIGDCVLHLHEDLPGHARGRAPASLGGTTVTFTFWTADVDGMYERALGAGATGDSPPAEAYWGARYARITDPSGHGWILSAHHTDTPADEQARRADAYFATTPASVPGVVAT